MYLKLPLYFDKVFWLENLEYGIGIFALSLAGGEKASLLYIHANR